MVDISHIAVILQAGILVYLDTYNWEVVATFMVIRSVFRLEVKVFTLFLKWPLISYKKNSPLLVKTTSLCLVTMSFTRVLKKSLAWPGRKQAWKHVRDAHYFNDIETQAVINPPPARQGAKGNSCHSDWNISFMMHNSYCPELCF